MCGEKLQRSRPPETKKGSPPHVRGKETEFATVDLAERITPACAGKRPVEERAKYGHRDHPRMCGEKSFFYGQKPGCLGSPPHVRGKALFVAEVLSAAGITPACAGKSCHRRRSSLADWDHPRMCGEKFICSSPLYAVVGSPPHVRGKETTYA